MSNDAPPLPPPLPVREIIVSTPTLQPASFIFWISAVNVAKTLCGVAGGIFRKSLVPAKTLYTAGPEAVLHNGPTRLSSEPVIASSVMPVMPQLLTPVVGGLVRFSSEPYGVRLG